MEQSKPPGRDRRLRPSTLIRDCSDRGEEREVFRGESGGHSSPSPHQDDSTQDDAEAENDFWSVTGDFTYRHHVEPIVKLYIPKEESFPIPLKYIDVTRSTHTSLDVLWEKQIDDDWNVDGEKRIILMHGQAGFTRFILLNERPQEGYAWSGEETDEETNDFKTRQCMARYVEAYVFCREKQSKTKMGYRETKARYCQTVT